MCIIALQLLILAFTYSCSYNIMEPVTSHESHQHSNGREMCIGEKEGGSECWSYSRVVPGIVTPMGVCRATVPSG